jgi:hypothetical protein
MGFVLLATEMYDKGKVTSAVMNHVMKACRGPGGKASCILNLGTRWRCFTSGEGVHWVGGWVDLSQFGHNGEGKNHYSFWELNSSHPDDKFKVIICLSSLS